MRVRAPLAACMRRMGCPDARTKRSAFFLCLLPVEMRCFYFAGGVAVHGPPVPRPAEPASAPAAVPRGAPVARARVTTPWRGH